MEDLTKAAMWRAAAIFRFRIQKNNWGMILILQVLLCNYSNCLSERLQDTSGEISKNTLHYMSCLAILSIQLVCVQQEIWVKLHEHDETRSNSWLKHVLLQSLTFSLFLCRHNLHLKSSCCCWVKALQVDLLMVEVEAGAAASASPCPLLLGRHLQPLLQADKSQQRCADAGSSILKQVLPMFPHLPGTPSPADTGYGSVKHGRTTRPSSPS